MDRLPFELLVKVFTHSESPVDLITCTATCQRWRNIIYQSDLQIFKDYKPIYSDNKQRLLRNQCPRFNASLREYLIDKSLSNKDERKVCQVNHASRTKVANKPPVDSYFSLPHSLSDMDEQLDYETGEKILYNQSHIESTDLPPNVELHHVENGHIVINYEKDGECFVIIKDFDNNELVQKSIGTVVPLKFMLTKDTLVVIEQDKTHYFSYPDLQLQSTDDEEYCDLKIFDNKYIIKPPQPTRTHQSSGELSIKFGNNWEQLFKLSDKFRHVHLNNFNQSSRHVCVSMTRRDHYMYHYLFVYDGFLDNVKSYIYVGTNVCKYGTWHLNWNGEAVYVIS